MDGSAGGGIVLTFAHRKKKHTLERSAVQQPAQNYGKQKKKKLHANRARRERENGKANNDDDDHDNDTAKKRTNNTMRILAEPDGVRASYTTVTCTVWIRQGPGRGSLEVDGLKRLRDRTSRANGKK